jgi:hypothetical protein
VNCPASEVVRLLMRRRDRFYICSVQLADLGSQLSAVHGLRISEEHTSMLARFALAILPYWYSAAYRC